LKPGSAKKRKNLGRKLKPRLGFQFLAKDVMKTTDPSIVVAFRFTSGGLFPGGAKRKGLGGLQETWRNLSEGSAQKS